MPTKSMTKEKCPVETAHRPRLHYNRAKSWRKEVSFTTKKAAFSPTGKNTETIASIIDFEGHAPAGIRTGSWEEDRPIGNSWGYVTGMHSSSPDTVISWLVDAVSKNGTLLLNVSPKADGTIPMDQQEVLLGVGKWLETNGEAIYDTHSWIKFQETGRQHIYFTVKGDVLYAILIGNRPDSDVLITSLARGQAPAGRVGAVSLLGRKKHLSFSQDSTGLKVKLPSPLPGESAYTLKITGLQMNPPTWTASGDPMPNNGMASR